MRFYYNAELTKVDGYKVKNNIIKEVIITDEEKGAYPFALYVGGEFIGKTKNLKNAEKLAKSHYGLHYKLSNLTNIKE